MIIARILFFVAICALYPRISLPFKSSIMKITRFLSNKIKFTSKRIYRTLNVKKASHYVWKELIKYHKSSGWNFGQFDNDKHIECSFKIDDTCYADFSYYITDSKLKFRSTILASFDEERTNDIMVLASHFIGLLNFGMVKVNLKYNYVEFVYSGDLLTYSLFPGEIEPDTTTHFDLAKDCIWSFTNLLESGEDPVFVFSELLRKKNLNS